MNMNCRREQKNDYIGILGPEVLLSVGEERCKYGLGEGEEERYGFVLE